MHTTAAPIFNMTNHIPLGGLEGVAGVIGVTTTAGRCVVFCEG